MADLYIYRKLVRRHWYGKFRLRSRFVILLVLALVAAAVFIAVDLAGNETSKPQTSVTKNVQISGNINTFQTDYFSFKDTGKWVLSQQESTTTKFVYFKFRGVQPQHQLVIYVNEEPIPLYLASSRVLPVRIVNNNALDITNVYGPCGSLYKPGELRQVKVVTIEGANMLCDPDTPQYSVTLAEVNGDWQLALQRRGGTPATYVITYRDQTLNPGPEAILRIAESFKSL